MCEGCTPHNNSPKAKLQICFGAMFISALIVLVLNVYFK